MSPTSGGLWKGGRTNIPSSPQSMVGRMLPVQAKPERYWSLGKLAAGAGEGNWIVLDPAAVVVMASEIDGEAPRRERFGWAALLATGGPAAGSANLSDAR